GSIVIAARPETVALGHGRLQPGEYVCLSLTDTGEGMDEDTLAKAIDPFFTTKEVGKGTGLGLPMVLGIIHGHQGHLTIDSAPGRGPCAALSLPRLANLERREPATPFEAGQVLEPE